MRIKVFKAATLKEAMADVKEELGVDAVILHTKKYRKGGFLGYKSKEVVEVTAAIEDEDQKPKKREPLKQLNPILPRTVLSQYKNTDENSQAPQTDGNGVAEPAAASMPLGSDMGFRPLTGSSIPSAKAAPQFAQPAAAQEKSSEEQEKRIRELQSELAEMKDMLTRVMSKDIEREEYTTLYQALQQADVDEKILKDMSKHCSAGDMLMDKDSDEAKKVLEHEMEEHMNCSDGIHLLDGKTKLVALIGATGVGKTTTLAKIAARFVLEKGVSAALITADTYRISAVEQLKTYSDIIGLPLEIVYSPEELQTAIEKHSDKRLVLIDTAGRSQHNEYQMQELKELLSVNESIEKHLVMSATTKNRDAEEILSNFAGCGPQHVIFTKSDETSSLGLLINQLYDKDITLSYITNGQSVPDDITPATSAVLAGLILR